MVWAKQSILGPKSRKALGRPISCSHPKREGFDEKMRICAILKGEIEDAPVVSKISCDFVVFRKKCWIITCFTGWIGRRTCNIDAIKLIETNVEKKQKDEGVVWAKQSILGPKSRSSIPI